MVGKGVNVNATDSDGWTAAMIAAMEPERLGVLGLLAQAGADLDKADGEDGWTPLFCAAVSGNASGLKFLLEARCDVDARSTTGDTAAMQAVIGGCQECLKALIEAGADLLALNEAGESALDIAVDSQEARSGDVIREALAKKEAERIAASVGPAPQGAKISCRI